MINVEIWASGGGTNADAIMQYFKGHLSIKVSTLGCNRREAGAFSVATKHNIRSVYWDKESWNSTEILRQLKDRDIDFIVLAGFLKLVPAEVTAQYAGKIVNIHPSLLPKFGGKDMYGARVHNAVLESMESQTGITIHEVNEEFDKGKLLAQFSTPLSPGAETLLSIQQKIQKLEHTNFAPTIEAWITSYSK
jgi:phosphoribosylglycinamide formyltransferase-1